MRGNSEYTGPEKCNRSFTQPFLYHTENGKGEVLAEYDAADNETLLLTVPDENGWDLYINGKKSTKYQAENTFIAVPVSKGHNTIQLRYHAPGLRAGIFSSVLALGLFSFLSLSRNRKKH